MGTQGVEAGERRGRGLPGVCGKGKQEKGTPRVRAVCCCLAPGGEGGGLGQMGWHWKVSPPPAPFLSRNWLALGEAASSRQARLFKMSNHLKIQKTKTMIKPRPVRLSSLSGARQSERPLVRCPVGAQAWVLGPSGPYRDVYKKPPCFSLTLMFLFLSLSLFPSLYK